MFPLKYGISFPAPFLNQAGAFVNVYTDGSIRLNHGGTEMGQGLFIKIAQVVAEVFQVDIDRIAITPTSTAKCRIHRRRQLRLAPTSTVGLRTAQPRRSSPG